MKDPDARRYEVIEVLCAHVSSLEARVVSLTEALASLYNVCDYHQVLDTRDVRMTSARAALLADVGEGTPETCSHDFRMDSGCPYCGRIAGHTDPTPPTCPTCGGTKRDVNWAGLPYEQRDAFPCRSWHTDPTGTEP
jgi:hypothetical protein